MLILFAGIAAAVVSQEWRESPFDDLQLAAADLPARGTSEARLGQPPEFESNAAGPLDRDAVDRSVIDASRLVRTGGPDRLARQSRRCHAELQSRPAMSRFDQCIAFDEAAAALLGGKPFGAAGQFDPSAITGRQIAAARRISDDYMGMDSRVARIRSQVAFALAPSDPQPAALDF